MNLILVINDRDYEPERENASGHIYSVDLKGVNSKGDLLKVIADSLRFPDYFGMNWDALEECLDEVLGTAITVLFQHADVLANLPLTDLRVFRSILNDVAEKWQREGKVLRFFFICQAPELLATVFG